jgi:hypothetical protein
VRWSLSSSFLLITHSVSGLLNQNAQKVDGSFANEVTNHLFEEHSPKEQTRVSNCTHASHIFSQCAATTCLIFLIFSHKGTTYPYVSYFYVPASYIMYLSDFCRFLLCTCEWERRGERRTGEGEGARERGIECILYRYS